MRLWSIHPRYLDRRGLGALWREGLLAQAVLMNKTKGWRSHPQLIRFREHGDPISAIGFYLLKIHEEASGRGYSYDGGKIIKPVNEVERIPITRGQLMYEAEILKERLSQRDARKLQEMLLIEKTRAFPEPHPIFKVVDGGVAPWETSYWKKAALAKWVEKPSDEQRD